MKAAVQVSKESADAAKISADASMKAAETAQAQLNAFQNIEGAHIGVGHFEGNIVEGYIGIPIENYGHTPSPRTFIFVHVYKMHTGEQMPFYSKSYNLGGDRTEIPPGTGKYGVKVPLELESGEIEKIRTGQDQLSIGISIKYSTVVFWPA